LRAIVLCLAVLATGPAMAADADERALDACVTRANGVDAQATACYGAAIGKADARMNHAYAQLKRRLEPAAFAKLQAAQRLWLQFRDAERAARAASLGEAPGTLDVMMVTSEEYDLVKSRADALESWLDAL
jgi:uncharacterized protein YecT (DUF1311 family)